jgi:RNA polymerase sigma-70 factor (ECF subfamily)
MEDGDKIFNNLQFSEDSFESKQLVTDTHNKLKFMIKELPETQREVLVMRHYMEMSFQEIAEATGVSINTALGRMRYALINLRKKVRKYNIAYDKNIYPE